MPNQAAFPPTEGPAEREFMWRAESPCTWCLMTRGLRVGDWIQQWAEKDGRELNIECFETGRAENRDPEHLDVHPIFHTIFQHSPPCAFQACLVITIARKAAGDEEL